ncbi:glycoside hydrolase family 20 protein [Carboxylicivirga sp. N1Y90]|uniref:glycoside hydrolase family 20 protein n=1 Tax=Carboxylicivirga fragile TaxID=3417571 RepID=UPI003D34DD50|nr:family 20 glycosylhydrolase [Marinilabiliaceae bacterium N1Y90]
MRHFLLIVIAGVLLAACTTKQKVEELNLIPYPVELEQAEGALLLSSADLNVSLQNIDPAFGQYLNGLVKQESGIEFKFSETGKIRFELNQDLDVKNEGYLLSISNQGVTAKAKDQGGLVYAAQTLRQLISVDENNVVKIPFLEITDYPRFKWRGMHFDVSRHFFTVNEIKRFLDYMAMNKLNTFHWHLMDDQGWRLEIKKYPKLTEIGAWREKVGFEANQKKGLNTANTEPYGGFYTQDQVKDIVAYAAQRNITVVPEIELPGHSAAALVAYPEYYCDNAGDLEIWDQAGVSAGVYCAGKESTFQFLEDVLAETLELFPAEFIHIGGDETPKDTWLACPDCRKRMEAEGAHDEHELQSYFVKRIEKYLNANGRRLIGWDEILDGGLAPNAAVMSWRGVAGGIKAAQAGHDVVMTPMFPYYFNHTQNHREESPGHPGIRTLRDVYTFPVIPADISEGNRAHIIGVQGNMWSEYMPKFKHIEYNLFPRVYAIAEVGWSPAQRPWEEFYGRVQSKLKTLEKYNIIPGDISYHVGINVEPNYADKSAKIEFIAERPDPIFFETDGSTPTKASQIYSESFVINKNVHIKACQFKENGEVNMISEKEIKFHKAFGKPYELKHAYAPQYDGGGKYGLTNGFLGVMVGVEEKPVDVNIDLGEVTEVSKITTRFKNQPMGWVFGPKEVRYLVSLDGENYTEVAVFSPGVIESDVNEVLEYPKEFEPVQAKYVKIVAESVGVCPDWHPAAGGKAWLFSDEIIVE